MHRRSRARRDNCARDRDREPHGPESSTARTRTTVASSRASRAIPYPTASYLPTEAPAAGDVRRGRLRATSRSWSLARLQARRARSSNPARVEDEDASENWMSAVAPPRAAAAPSRYNESLAIREAVQVGPADRPSPTRTWRSPSWATAGELASGSVSTSLVGAPLLASTAVPPARSASTLADGVISGRAPVGRGPVRRAATRPRPAGGRVFGLHFDLDDEPQAPRRASRCTRSWRRCRRASAPASRPM